MHVIASFVAVVLFVVPVLSTSAQASDGGPSLSEGIVAPTDTLTEAHGWVTHAIGTVNLSQAAYSNWQEGGINALAATANIRARFARVSGAFHQRHDGRLGFGVLQQDTLNVRKALDIIRYTFNLQYEIGEAVRPTFATEIRTQFAPGFDYDPAPDRYPELAHLIVPGERLKVSDFFAPAEWTQSLGVTYEPSEWFSARGGLGLKQTIVMIERLRPVYGNRIDQPIRNQAGLDVLLEARGEIFDNVHVQSRLSLFQAFTEVAEAAPDMFWETGVQLQVNRWLSIDGEFAALYDRDVLDRIQLKQILSLGVSITLI